MEGLAYNQKNNKAYVVISYLENTMLAEPGAPADDIQLQGRRRRHLRDRLPAEPENGRRRENRQPLRAGIDERHADGLQAISQGAVVTIRTNKKVDVVIGELNGQTIKKLEEKQVVLEIKTATAAYTIPMQLININAIAFRSFGHSS